MHHPFPNNLTSAASSKTGIDLPLALSLSHHVVHREWTEEKNCKRVCHKHIVTWQYDAAWLKLSLQVVDAESRAINLSLWLAGQILIIFNIVEGAKPDDLFWLTEWFWQLSFLTTGGRCFDHVALSQHIFTNCGAFSTIIRTIEVTDLLVLITMIMYNSGLLITYDASVHFSQCILQYFENC